MKRSTNRLSQRIRPEKDVTFQMGVAPEGYSRNSTGRRAYEDYYDYVIDMPIVSGKDDDEGWGAFQLDNYKMARRVTSAIHNYLKTDGVEATVESAIRPTGTEAPQDEARLLHIRLVRNAD